MANHPPPEKVATIIVFRPGAISQALRTMLAVLPQIEKTAAVGGGLSALNLVRQNRPALPVIDTSLPEDEILDLRRQIKLKEDIAYLLRRPVP